MTHFTPISFDDLQAAFDWVSAGAPSENSAFIDRQTGVAYWASDINDSPDELPDDIEDASRYLAVPHKNDLDLGRALALRFAQEVLPDHYQAVSNYFRERGAYARFKRLLEQQGVLHTWFEFEARAAEGALRSWAQDNGLQIA